MTQIGDVYRVAVMLGVSGSGQVRVRGAARRGQLEGRAVK